MVKYYDIAESDLSSKPFEAEALYYCTDSGNIYFDSPLESERKQMSTDTVILKTDDDRTGLLAPIPNKIYVVLETGALFMYNGGNWIKLTESRPQFELSNILVKAGSHTIIDARIKATSKARFVPDLSFNDLVTTSDVKCVDGSLTITITPATYNIVGRVIVE